MSDVVTGLTVLDVIVHALIAFFKSIANLFWLY